MKSLWKHVWLTAAAVALLLSPLAKVHAQEIKPVAVISVTNVDKLLGDIDYLTKAGGAADAGRLVTLMAGPYVAGLDRTKPAGAYVIMNGEEPVTIGFIPTKDLTTVLATLKDSIGEPTDLGDGVQQVGEEPMAVCIKQVGAYAFLAQTPEQLKNLPKDPAALLGNLPKDYSIAAKVMMKNVPAHLKEQAIQALKDGAESAPIDAEDPAQRELLEKLQGNSVQQFTQLIEETDEIVFGWAIDPIGKSTFMDFVFTAVEGTKLARTMAGLQDAKTNFAGFLQPDAAFTMNLSQMSADPDQVAQAVASIDTVRTTAMKELDKDESMDEDEKTAAKELLGTVFDVFKATLQSGKIDGGAVALAEEKELTFVAGGHVVDAAKLEAAVKKAVAFVQQKHPDELAKIDIQFDASKHGGIRFHSIKVPLDDPKAQDVFGDKLDLILGAGDKSIFLAFGSKAESSLKDIIDKSAADAGKAVPPMQMSLGLGALMKFAASVEDNPVTSMLAAAADRVKGNDHIKIDVKAISNGELMRFKIEEGVLQMIGEAAKSAQGGGDF